MLGKKVTGLCEIGHQVGVDGTVSHGFVASRQQNLSNPPRVMSPHFSCNIQT